MSLKFKYTLLSLAGFLAVFAIGIAGIYLLRAKRSTAPEVDVTYISDSNMQVNHTSVPTSEEREKLASVQGQWFNVPTEISATEAKFTDLPLAVQELLREYATTSVVHTVNYATDEKGFRVEQDIELPLLTLAKNWQIILDQKRLLLGAKNNPPEVIMGARVDTNKLVFNFSKLGDSSSGLTIRIIQSK